MSKRILFFDVDTQYDFIMPDGCLYVPGGEELIDNLKKLTRFAVENKITIFASADSHPKNAKEFADFPQHCLADSPGNRKLEETTIPGAIIQSYLGPDQKYDPHKTSGVIFTKNALDVFSNPFLEDKLDALKPDIVVLYGVATEYCVDKAVRGLIKNGYTVHVVTDAISAVDKKEGRAALDYFKSKGVQTRTTKQILAKKF